MIIDSTSLINVNITSMKAPLTSLINVNITSMKAPLTLTQVNANI